MNTEIVIPVTSLKSVLPGLSKIIPKTASLPIVRCVRVTQSDHTIRLEATNLEESVSVCLGQSSTGSGELLVPLEELLKLSKNCPHGDSIRFIGSDTETKVSYLVAGHWVERPLAFFDIKDWPAQAQPESEPLALNENFKLALKEALECASSDPSRHVLNGACLDVSSQEAHYVVGTDGQHLYAANSFLFDIPTSLTVPTRRFLGWPGFFNDGPWKLRFDPEVEGKTALFSLQSDHWSYIARPLQGSYPNWRQVVPKESRLTRIVLDAPSVQTILDALPLLPGVDRRFAPVTLVVNAAGFCIKGKGEDDTQWTSIPIPGVKAEGSPAEVTLNRVFLSKALRFGLNQIDIADTLTPVIFTSKGKRLVAMPLRTESEPTPVPTEPQITPPQEEPAVTPPSVPEVQQLTEMEKAPMIETTEMTVPVRGNLKPTEERSAVREIIAHIEAVKTSLREVISDLNDTLPLLREALKEKKATEKEITAIRSTLRSLQNVEF